MPRTADCDYCGADIEPGTGTMLVLTDGTTVHYCSAKCEKNDDLGREARDLNWTEAGRSQPTGTETETAEPAKAEPGDEPETQGTVAEDEEAAPEPDGETEDEAAADADTEPAEAVEADNESEAADEDAEETNDEETEAEA